MNQLIVHRVLVPVQGGVYLAKSPILMQNIDALVASTCSTWEESKFLVSNH